jgi:hypothetical protein
MLVHVDEADLTVLESLVEKAESGESVELDSAPVIAKKSLCQTIRLATIDKYGRERERRSMEGEGGEGKEGETP